MSITIHYEVIRSMSALPRINVHRKHVLLPVRGKVIIFVVFDKLNGYKNGTDVSKIILFYPEIFSPFIQTNGATGDQSLLIFRRTGLHHSS